MNKNFAVSFVIFCTYSVLVGDCMQADTVRSWMDKYKNDYFKKVSMLWSDVQNNTKDISANTDSINALRSEVKVFINNLFS